MKKMGWLDMDKIKELVNAIKEDKKEEKEEKKVDKKGDKHGNKSWLPWPRCGSRVPS